jgi:tetratricopeptide (TPR) repeat protein
MRVLVIALITLGLSTFADAQCETWNNKPNMDDLVQDHVVYKGFLKDEKYDDAFPYWEKVYKAAPYADGRRTDHFYDGQQFYIRKFAAATTDADKENYRKLALAIFDQEAACTGTPGPAMGRKGYYMFYNLASPYPETYKALKQAVDAGGNAIEYIVLVPMAYVLADQFTNKRISVDEARDVFTKLISTTDTQIAAGGTYAAQYQQAKDAMMPTLEQIEGKLFDCEWFKARLEPIYRANPDDGEKIKEIYVKLANQNCSETDPLLLEIKAKYEVYAAEMNAKLLAEFHEKNPAAHAAALMENGKYSEALARYKDALEAETENDKKADYYQAMASIEFRQLEHYATARDYARRALKIRPNWGLPLLLIGDMYARSYRSCGSTDFEQRVVILAAIEKYQEAKALDPSIASQANERISRYMSARPSYEDGHMLGKAEGQSQAVGCWIGESVTLRFNK